MQRLRFLPVILILVAALLCCCSERQSALTDETGDNIFRHAVYLRGNAGADSNSMKITVINPWDSSRVMAVYRLYPAEGATPAAADGEIPLSLPLKRLIVYSSVHAALLVELGYTDAIAGVADAAYITTPEIVERLKDGRITDIGSSMEPSIEKILALKPDAILISPFQNAGHGVVDKAGVPVIECADYMETSPLGRAEWSRFYAMLVEGVGDSNSRLFDQTEQRYNALADTAATLAGHPTVITEMLTDGVWMMPGGDSYAARLITDAGGHYPYSDNRSTGSLTMNYEKVYSTARDADFWLVKSFGVPVTLADIAANHKLNVNFKSYREGGIYYVNTAQSGFFEQTPFHPDLLLADYVAMFHHTGDSLRYFTPVR